jgi:Do/DeqQ family serine protease
LWKPLAATALLAFALGACVRQNGGASTLDPAQAQTTGANSVGVLSESAARSTVRNVGDLNQLSATFADIARRVTPAVVNIESQTVIPGRTLHDPFAELFGDDGGGGMMREPDRRQQSLGSGVIVSADGLIVTNNHVIGNATQIRVTLSDKRRFNATRVGSDPDTDVAVLRIRGANLPALKWSDSNALEVGEIVLAIGSPFNLSSTVTQGILSAKGRRDLGISAYEDFLQTDAAINPGNSGGALVDVAGNLIGINTAILSRSGGSQGIGLAIPSNLARKIAADLSRTGQVTRGWLGMVVEPVTEDMAAQLQLGETRGVLVTGAYTRGPVASLPWARNGTVIVTQVNGTPIDSPGQLRILMSEIAPGSEVKIRVWQDGAEREYSVQAGRRSPRVQGV